MEKEQAKILLPNGEVIERTVTSVLKQVGPLCVGYWQRTVMYKDKKYTVEEYAGRTGVKYVLKS